jgi:hypothetical protein
MSMQGLPQFCEIIIAFMLGMEYHQKNSGWIFLIFSLVGVITDGALNVEWIN